MLSLADAIAIARRARKLLRAGRITHRQFVIIDCLLWSCRNPRTGAIVVSYSALQRLAHVSRETIAGALRVLERLGVLTRIKRRVRLAWHQGGVTSRQLANAYMLHSGGDTEFGSATVIQKRESILTVPVAVGGDVAAARAALAAVAAARKARLRMEGV